MRRIIVTVLFVPCAMFLLGVILGVMATDDPVRIG